MHPPSPGQGSLLLLARLPAEPIAGTSSPVRGHRHFPLLPWGGCSTAFGFVPFALLRLQDDCPFGGARGFARRGVSATARSVLLPLSSSAPSSQGALGWRIPATTADALPTFLAVSTILQHPQPQKASAASRYETWTSWLTGGCIC